MKCKICGAESKSYHLCKACHIKKVEGKIIKCLKCQQWHDKDEHCKKENLYDAHDTDFLYERKQSLLTETEKRFYSCIEGVLPSGYILHMQSNLATFIQRTDNARYQNELFRNVDFLITDDNYIPMCVIEINDDTHFQQNRKQRDIKVKKICEEAGIPVITFWVNKGVNKSYIESKITETLAMMPVKRIHHFEVNKDTSKTKKKGCYVATCVYGSYDCPQVCMLRRFRDQVLEQSWYGRLFIFIYYKLSPKLVNKFKNCELFHRVCKKWLDTLVHYLYKKGYQDTPYID